MSVNSSSSSSPTLDSSSDNIYDFLQNCNSTSCASSLTAYTVSSLLLVLPPCVYVVYLGLRRRRLGTPTTHADVFTYHMVAIELMNIVGNLLFCFGVFTRLSEVVMGSMYLTAMNMYGQLYYHTLTCVERYLAVVHPVTYLGLRNQKGVRVRNVSIGCVWLLCIAIVGLTFVKDTNFIYILPYCTLTFIFIVVSFCSLSALRVLIGPGPGAGGAGRQRVDRAKMRAFYTLLVILGVLLVRLVGTTVTALYSATAHLGGCEKCTMLMSVPWMSLPSSLVLPLLFVHRAGKLLHCRNLNE